MKVEQKIFLGGFEVENDKVVEIVAEYTTEETLVGRIVSFDNEEIVLDMSEKYNSNNTKVKVALIVSIKEVTN